MKTLLTPNFAILLLLLLLPDLSPSIYAQGGTSGDSNPIMIIRCRAANEGEFATSSDKKAEAKVFFNNTDFRDDNFIVTDEDCYTGNVQLAITDVDCNNPEAITTATFCFTAAPGSADIDEGDFITFTDLTNCLNGFDEEYLAVFEDVYDLEPNETYSFGPADVDGKIIVPNIFIDRDVDVVLTQTNGTIVTATADCDPIPTMGQWALMILGLLFASLGLVFISRKQLA